MLHVGRRVVPTDLYHLGLKVSNVEDPASGFRFNPVGLWRKREELVVLLSVEINCLLISTDKLSCFGKEAVTQQIYLLLPNSASCGLKRNYFIH